MATGFSLLRGLKEQFGDPIVLEIDTSLNAGLNYAFNLTAGFSGLYSTNGTTSYQILVTWGDGTYNYYNPGNSGSIASRTYAAGGVYQIKIYGRVRGLTTNTNPQKLQKILSWGRSSALSVVSIGQSSKLTSVPNYLPPTVKSLNGMFQGCTTINDPNIALWDTTNVTSMQTMFSTASAFNQDISVWNVSNVTAMGGILDGTTAFNQNLGSWTLNSLSGAVSIGTSGMSNDNYSKTLIGWANYASSTGNAKSKTLSGGTRKYNSTVFSGSPYNTGSAARTYLVTATGSGGGGWTITDGGAGA